jgi:hypothetical protein
MATYSFDDSNIKWNRHPDLEHLEFTILNVDEKNYILDILFKFDANEKIILHRHMVHNNTFVVKSRRSGRSAATNPARQATCIERVAVPIKTSWSFSTFVATTACYTNCSTTSKI